MSLATQICSFEVEKYAREYTFGGTREGYIIHLKDTAGNTACGEVAPLPGRSMETTEQAYENLIAIRKNFLDGTLQPLTLHPSVMFGMQMALYSLHHKPSIPKLPITQLFFSPPPSTPKGAIKIKLGKHSLEDATSFFNACDQGQKEIRIDLERKWPLEKTVEFCNRVNTSSIYYIEDPVTNYTDLETFYEQTGVPYALDNFLIFQPAERIKLLKGLHTIVVKPSLVGGIQECKQLQEIFAPIPVTFSSLFETKVGIEHIILISSLLCGNKTVGVDTLKYFKVLNDSHLL